MAPWRIPFGLGSAAFLAAGALWAPCVPAWMPWLLGATGLVFFALAGSLSRKRRGSASLAATIAVAALATAAGVLRVPGVSHAPVPGHDVEIAGEVLSWKPVTGGSVFRIRVVRARGELAGAVPFVAEGFAPAEWGAVPASRWMRVRGDLLPERGPTNPGGRRFPSAAARFVRARGSRPDWGPGRAPRLLRWRHALARAAHKAGLPLAEGSVLDQLREDEDNVAAFEAEATAASGSFATIKRYPPPPAPASLYPIVKSSIFAMIDSIAALVVSASIRLLSSHE